MRILIVEDEFEVRSLLKTILSQHGECDTAVTGVEAIEIFDKAVHENNPYALVCLDLMIPNTDGEQTLHEMRKIEKKKKIDAGSKSKIIIISAVIEPAVVSDAVEKWGASSYIIKPFKKKQLMDEMKKLGLIK